MHRSWMNNAENIMRSIGYYKYIFYYIQSGPYGMLNKNRLLHIKGSKVKYKADA